MSELRGTITALDPQDALGWIDLDGGGGRIRFGGSALKDFRVPPGIGSRVLVHGTVPGYGGVTKAVKVTPLEPPPAPTVVTRAPVETIPWPAFVAHHPRFSDALDTCVPCARPAPPIALERHPLFDPWRDEIARAPTAVGLTIPPWNRRDPIEPTASDSFALGRTAFLETPEWPACGVCHRAMGMCTQLAPSVMADFGGAGRGLVALFCFACGMRTPADPRVGFVRWVVPAHRIVGPDVFASDAERSLLSVPQRVTPHAPGLAIPGSTWLAYRSERVAGTASGALLGDTPPPLGDPFPEGLDRETLDEMLGDVGATFDDWIDPQRPGGTWGGAMLGGVAGWDQYDATPSCTHGEQLHLLDYDGGQFGDGALHVFVCREGVCDPRFVAEF